MKLTSIVLTKNSQNFIEGCLKSLHFSDEIIVIDDFSTDDTLKIAQKLKLNTQNHNLEVKLFKRHLNDDFAAQRNFGLKFARGEWVLFLDSDEVVPHELAREILYRTAQFTNYAGFLLRRRDFMWGEELKFGEFGDISLVRLAKRNAGQWRRRVHEYWDVKAPVRILENQIKHFPHQSLDEFIKKTNWLSTVHAEENRGEGKRSTIIKIIFWPAAKFVYNYFIKLGALDGMPGFVCALIMSFHSYLSWSKLWLIQKKKS